MLEAAAGLRSGALTADALLQRLLRNAVRVDAATNCITEFPAPLAELAAGESLPLSADIHTARCMHVLNNIYDCMYI